MLSKTTVKELLNRRDICNDEIEIGHCVDEYRAELADVEAALKDQSLAGHAIAARALDDALNADWAWTFDEKRLSADGLRVFTDLVRAGHMAEDVFNPRSAYSRKPKTVDVDGVRYIIG